MTDTGQVPGEGLPESAGMVEQPGAHAPGAYTYLSETAAEDEELLLPGAQGAWGNEVPPPAPEPVVQVVHEPGPHETDGRDSGAVDLSAVRMSEARPATAESAPFRTPVATSVPQPPVARRPPYLAPPTPGGTPSPVRSLADRGPAGAPTPPAAVRQPARPASGPEYLDVPQHAEAGPGTAPWVTAPAAAPVATVPDPAGDDLAPQTTQAAQAPHDPELPPEPEGSLPPQASEPAPAPQPEQPAETETDTTAAVHDPEAVQEQPAAPGEAPAWEQRPTPGVPADEPQPAQELPAAQDTPQVTEDQATEVSEVTEATEATEATEVPEAAQTPPAAQPQPTGQDTQAVNDPADPADLAPDEAVHVPDTTLPADEAAPEPQPEQPAPVAVAPATDDPVAVAVPDESAPAQPPAPVAPVAPVEDDTPPAEPAAEPSLTVPAGAAAHAAPLPDAVPPAQPLPDEQPLQAELPATDAEQPVAVAQAPVPEAAVETEEAPAEAPEEAPAATVPAPRRPEPPAAAPAAPDPEVVQSAEDLDTRAADQEDQHDQQDAYDQHDQEEQQEVSTAAVAEVREPAGPAAPGYDDAEREAVLRVMRERRDIRNGFRGDPIPHEVLLRVLEAAHTAPSVGHSQPWDFVVIRSADTRRAMHELAQRQREAYAKSLPKGRAKQFKELKIEAILDTPVNIVVTADPTRGGRHTLGRHTQPQMAPYSSALAVENLWLAARAEGLGVGWVSFFDEREMVRVLGLPEHLEVVAYLCVGYVDEFPDEPELMQAGWSKRRPLSWVVHEETYGRRALPGAAPHDLLAETVAGIRPLDAKALGEAWERQKRMTKPAGALGMLEIISAQLSGLSRQCPPPIPEPAAVAVFAGDHGVHAQGVTPWPQEVTAQMVANFLGGGAVCNAFASQVGAEVCVVDVGVAAELPATPGLLPRKVRAGTADMTTGPALTREEVKQAIEVGIETARDLVAAGNKALLTGEMGIANTTASAALISVFTETDPAEVTGRGTGINDETLARKTEVVRRALELHQPDPADPIGVLAAVGGLEHAAIVGLLLGGASLRTPVILDGVSAGAAALVARAIAPEVLAACIAGHRSAEPGHVAALKKLGLRPLVDLDLRLGEGTGALLALPMIQSTARAMHEVATFDSAGVTEK